jgi:predicted transcriptional regulator
MAVTDGHGGGEMTRPRAEQPTQGELEILKVLWGLARPATVREAMEEINSRAKPARAYTSVMSLMNVMAEKGQLRRSPAGRAFVYEPAAPRDQTLGSLLGETLRRAYDGSASLLVSHLLDQSRPTGKELDQIRTLLDRYESAQENGEGGPS